MSNLLELDPVAESDRLAHIQAGKRESFGTLPPVRIRPEGVKFFKHIDEWNEYIDHVNNSGRTEDELFELWSKGGDIF